MEWILKNLPLVVAFVFVLVSIIRAIARAQQMRNEHQRSPGDTDEARRIREIQEQIRRRVAERREEDATQGPPPLYPAAPARRAVLEREPPAPPDDDPFGGSVRRAFEHLERRLQPPPVPPRPERSRAEIERQQRIAEQLREAEQARAEAQRRVAHVARDRGFPSATERVAGGGPLRRQLLADLSDPHGLRRAFLLKEILGPPPGLR
jgi:C4-dicarboxylate-specific signal transduction histidine kinase